MAKPKGGTLAALWEVSDKERQEFFNRIQKRSPAPLEETNPDDGTPVPGIPVQGIPTSGVPANVIDRASDYPELPLGSIPEKGTPFSGAPVSGTPAPQVPAGSGISDVDKGQKPGAKIQPPTGCIPFSGTPDLAPSKPPVTSIGLAEPVEINSLAYDGIPKSGTPDNGTPLTGAPFIGIPVTLPIETFRPGTTVRKIRRATQVQDGHSLGEHLILTTLWKDPTAVPVAPSTKRITIGYRTLSEKCRLTVNNCKANLRSLQQKLAIQAIVAPSNSQATTYLVYDFAEIIRRREAAGMTHVIRSKGCLFVNPETGAPVTGIPVTGTATTPESGTPPSVPGVPETDKTGIPAPGTPIRTKTEASQKQTSSSTLAVIFQAATQLGVPLDDDAVRKLVSRCREVDASASQHEIAHFLAIKIRQLQHSKTVSNLVGLLIASVPVFFGPPATELRRYRESKTAEAREVADRDEQLLAEARKILDDPNASESDKAMARNWLRT
jgi:hypothetical protein